MASDQFILKEDGFLNIGTQSSTITYHSSLNVILVFNRENEVKVLDVHSTVILKSCKLSGECLGSLCVVAARSGSVFERVRGRLHEFPRRKVRLVRSTFHEKSRKSHPVWGSDRIPDHPAPGAAHDRVNEPLPHDLCFYFSCCSVCHLIGFASAFAQYFVM